MDCACRPCWSIAFSDCVRRLRWPVPDPGWSCVLHLQLSVCPLAHAGCRLRDQPVPVSAALSIGERRLILCDVMCHRPAVVCMRRLALADGSLICICRHANSCAGVFCCYDLRGIASGCQVWLRLAHPACGWYLHLSECIWNMLRAVSVTLGHRLGWVGGPEWLAPGTWT